MIFLVIAIIMVIVCIGDIGRLYRIQRYNTVAHSQISARLSKKLLHSIIFTIILWIILVTGMMIFSAYTISSIDMEFIRANLPSWLNALTSVASALVYIFVVIVNMILDILLLAMMINISINKHIKRCMAEKCSIATGNIVLIVACLVVQLIALILLALFLIL